MGHAETEPVPVHRAATVILVRDGEAGLEALLVRRNSNLVFHGGSWVFPGGRMDPGDYSTGDLEDHDAAAVVAAIRESQEEAGLVVTPTTLVPFAHWTTPPGRPRRFATWFFLAPAPTGDVATDGTEIDDHRWFTPTEALAARDAGEIELPPPTFVSLLRLSTCAHLADALDQIRTYPYLEFHPHPATVDGTLHSLYEGDVAYDDTSRFHDLGARHRLSMGDGAWSYERSAR